MPRPRKGCHSRSRLTRSLLNRRFSRSGKRKAESFVISLSTRGKVTEPAVDTLISSCITPCQEYQSNKKRPISPMHSYISGHFRRPSLFKNHHFSSNHLRIVDVLNLDNRCFPSIHDGNRRKKQPQIYYG